MGNTPKQKNTFHNSESIIEKLLRKNSHDIKPKTRALDSLLDESELEQLDRQIDEIIEAAAKKTDHSNLMQNKKRFEYVKTMFKENYKKWSENGALSTLDLANIALLGVMSAHITGAQRIVIQAGSRIRNDYAAPCFNPYETSEAIISRGKHIDFSYGDSLGLEALGVKRLLRTNTAIYPGLIAAFVAAGFINNPNINQQEQKGGKSPFTTPELKPPVRFTDDGEGD